MKEITITWLGFQETPSGKPIGLWNVVGSDDPRLAVGSTVTLRTLRRLGVGFRAVAATEAGRHQSPCIASNGK